jgi:AcrR family transcriptional regulator
MMRVSRDYVGLGRTRQKQRTRDQLVAAAAQLMESGDTPRVEDAAAAAGISRTTAYRYFASQNELLAAAFPETVTASMLPDAAPADAVERVSVVAAGVLDVIDRTEHLQRTMLRLSLDGASHDLPLRQGRAIGWYAEALQPLAEELGSDVVRRLAVALRSVSGIETRVWLHDVAGLSGAEVRHLQLWMVEALTRRALDGDPPADG